MKRLFIIALLAMLALPAMATPTNRIVFVYAEDLKKPDKTIAKLDSKTLFGDSSQVRWDAMTRLCLISNTNILFRAIDFTVDLGTVKKNVTKEKAEKDVKDKLAEKAKCQVYACGEDWLADLVTLGYTNRATVEPVPTPAPSETP